MTKAIKKDTIRAGGIDIGIYTQQISKMNIYHSQI